MPDSGNAAALGYSQNTKINFDLGLIRNHYVGRTFIEPSQKIRSLGVKLKLNANQSAIKNKKIILIDDSLVRGTTCYKIVKMLYDAGAKEVHVKIACPEIKYPDFYGVDTPTKKELLAANKTNKEIETQRFRGNIYAEGIEAWEERNWIGKIIKINNISFKVEKNIYKFKYKNG